MTHWLAKDSQALEGACGKILETDDSDVVIKRMHRPRLERMRSKCLGARGQCAMQQWASDLLTPANGFSVLYTPKAWLPAEPEKMSREYLMQKIDCLAELNPSTLCDSEMAELKLFYEKAQSTGIFPCDYELYRQADGRIALIDFDKFSLFKDNKVTFPWGTTMSPIYPFST